MKVCICGWIVFRVWLAWTFLRTGWWCRALQYLHAMPHSAYLLRSSDPRMNKAYIGYNINHCRRLRQHNGEIAGGPSSTLSGRPWTYAALVTGFPNGTAARIFEWAWANPRVSVGSPWAVSRLRRDGLFGGKNLFKQLNQATRRLAAPVSLWRWRLQVLAIMLSIPGWAGLNLR